MYTMNGPDGNRVGHYGNTFRAKKLRQPISTHLSTPPITWFAGGL